MEKLFVKRYLFPFAVLVAAGLLVFSCGPSKKVTELRKQKAEVGLVLPGGDDSSLPELEAKAAVNDTIVIKDDDGSDIIIMKAIKDEETGDMVANEVLDAAVVTARFRNKAERRGKVDLEFQVIVPASMQDTKWQLRMYPQMFILDDSLRLEPVMITGMNYRKGQLRGYEQYNRFLSKIVSDTTKFINVKQLERFLKRNIPYVYAFKFDESYVADEEFYSYYGVSEQEAVDHYTNMYLKRRNQRRIANKAKMYARYGKAPIVNEGIRLDTVIRSTTGDIVYNYVQTINARPLLRKVDVVLDGAIFEQDKIVYSIPRTSPLTFYISSISSFVNLSEKYLTRVIERKAEANASYEIEFPQGRSELREDYANNFAQVGLVKDNLVDLLQNDVFELDSIVVVANSSPEGSVHANSDLSRRRGEAVVAYFDAFVRDHRRRIAQEEGFSVDLEGNIVTAKDKMPAIRFITRSVPENWAGLGRLVANDTRLSEAQKARYGEIAGISDLDAREAALRREDFYRYVEDSLYTKLRVVDFKFNLHRKGMVKDTVHTTEVDARYMRGVRLLKDMDYEEAVKILGPYQDFNSAIAYMAVDRNASAMLILQNLPRDPKVNYLLAILYSRNGETQKAVQCYLDACRKDPSYIHRGNLDPEISVLIKAYGLNKQDDDDIELDY